MQEKGLFHPLHHRFAEFVRHSHSTGLPVLRPDGAWAGIPGVIVTGTGPSLTRQGVLDDIRLHARRGWKVVACKESIAILKGRGIPVHYGVATDPKEDQIPKTMFSPEIEYLFGTIVHPTFLNHFRQLGAKVTLFHTHSGLEEDGLRPRLGESPDQCLVRELWGDNETITEGGVSVVSRTLGIAAMRGARTIIAAGVDFGWRPGSSYYARGAKVTAGNHGPIWTDDGYLDGTPWFSKHDQLICAEHLARAVVNFPGLTVLGDTIAKGLYRRFGLDIKAGRTCFGRCFKRVLVDPPPLGAPLRPPPLSPEDAARARALGYDVPSPPEE